MLENYQVKHLIVVYAFSVLMIVKYYGFQYQVTISHLVVHPH